MKLKQKAIQLLIVLGLIVVCTANGQSAKKQVKVKVVSTTDGKVVEMDTTFNHDVIVYKLGDETKVVNIDSIINAHMIDVDKHMRVMAFKLDSLDDFHFEFDGDMEKFHIEMERMMKERGVHLKELERVHDDHCNKMIFIEGEEGNFDIEEFINEDGDHVKIIKKEIHEENSDGPGAKKIIIRTDSEGDGSFWKDVHFHNNNVKVEAIPIDDLTLLKKAGLSSKMLLSEPMDLEDVKVRVEKIIDDKLEKTLLNIECNLPDGEYEMNLINQVGEKVKEEKDIPKGEFKEEFDLNKQEAPYYFILSKNNRLFGRKIIL